MGDRSESSGEVLEILATGLRASLQSMGRAAGWRRYGVPPGGAMDDHAAQFANRLLDNPANAPVLELLLQGARLRVLRSTWLAVTGASSHSNVPLWRTLRVEAGQTIRFPRHETGVWIYMAVEGGFALKVSSEHASACGTVPPGRILRAGDRLHGRSGTSFQMVAGVAGRIVDWNEQRDYDDPPELRVWPGPQWEAFPKRERQAFLKETWTVTPQSDRIGYRLEGPSLKTGAPSILSEPVRVGSIQVPDNGQPIVTMRDGPTVGGYPKIAMVDPRDLSWLTQVSPGRSLRFQLIDS